MLDKLLILVFPAIAAASSIAYYWPGILHKIEKPFVKGPVLIIPNVRILTRFKPGAPWR